jgi:hypothetical protein
MTESTSVKVLSAEIRILQLATVRSRGLCTGNSTKQPLSGSSHSVGCGKGGATAGRECCNWWAATR